MKYFIGILDERGIGVAMGTPIDREQLLPVVTDMLETYGRNRVAVFREVPLIARREWHVEIGIEEAPAVPEPADPMAEALDEMAEDPAEPQPDPVKAPDFEFPRLREAGPDPEPEGEDIPEGYMTIQHAAALRGCLTTNIGPICHNNDIPTLLISRRRYVEREAFERWNAANPKKEKGRRAQPSGREAETEEHHTPSPSQHQSVSQILRSAKGSA